MRYVFPISYKKRVMLEDDRRTFFLGNRNGFLRGVKRDVKKRVFSLV